MRMSVRRRFAAAYAALALVLAATGFATAEAVTAHRPAPLAPEAVAVVRAWLDALTSGDRTIACRLFSALPACSGRGAFVVRRYKIHAAERAVDGVDVPVTIDDEYALVSLTRIHGRYRIVDVVANPRSIVGQGSTP